MNGSRRKPVFCWRKAGGEAASGFSVFREGGTKMDVNICVMGKMAAYGNIGQAVYIDTGGAAT